MGGVDQTTPKNQESTSNRTPLLVDFNTVYKYVGERFSPVPHRRTVMAWLKDSRVRSTKRNPHAVRGGGRRWFVLADVQTLIERMCK